MRTKRFRIALAVLLVVALSPFAGVTAFGAGGNGGSRGENASDVGAGARAQTAGSTAPLAASGEEAIADGNTASTWRDWGLENSTENVGRIWTDKTVQAGNIVLTGSGGEKTIEKGDSTFLTALSAISSTSNLKSTATTPLDIVLVLDASGSMNDAMGSGDQTKRIDALKEAANSFIDEIAKQNAGVSDAAKQHQVAIVKFAGDESNRVGNDMYRDGQNTYNYSQVMKAMTACTDSTAESFKDTVNSIKPAGATRADNGLKRAKSQTSNRSDAKKVVVFFTDGKPTSFSEFDPEVAKGAVDAAKTMKDAGALVYTIGIFDGANPSADVSSNSTSNENKFMQASSSNYPDATYANGRGGYSWNFGDRAQDSDFYKSATNADELKKVFDDISQEITKGAGYPTETKDGYEADSGFITFTDQLGDYMQVDSFTNIVFANQVFESPEKTTSTNGLVDTYTFAGEAATALYPKGNLKDIEITVTHSEDLQTGDLVEVKIPAALIPLRQFEVNEDGTGNVTLTFPIRVFYGSSLKDGVADQLANPGSELAAYVAQNSADGKVNFLANKWTGGTDGDVVANFMPSKGNSYYYITEDTPIYQDEACTQRASAPLEQGKTYYYQRTWYDIDNGKAVKKTKTVSFDSGVVENIDGYVSSDNGKAYFKAGTPRMTYINELNTAKGGDKSGLSANNTNTASTFINPKWSKSASEQVDVLLGNNGKLSVAQPGTLAISKTLEVPEGYNVADFADDSFDFDISIPKAAGMTLKAQVKNASGEAVGGEFDIAFDKDGKATHSLRSGETLYVYGLAAGAEYSVTETAKAGFTQTAPANQAGEAVAATGAIEAGQTAQADFANQYAAVGTLDGKTALAGEKVLTGRSWLATDKFTFLLKDANTSVEAPMPEGAVDGVARMELTQSEGTLADKPVAFNFGNITYTYPGTYTYEIWESEEASTLNPGISASQALYKVVVQVTDERHDGSLTVSSTMTKLANDDGETLKEQPTVEVAMFVNEYDTQVAKWNPSGAKHYTDSTGANPLKQGMFNVVALAKDGDPLLQAAGAEVIQCVLGGVSQNGVLTSVEEGGNIAFPQATYESADVGKTFEYQIVEVVKNSDGAWAAVKDALADTGYVRDGMQYDPAVWTVKVEVQKNSDDVLVLNVKYLKDGVEQQGSMFSFSNAYNPAPAEATIEGSKTLTGRDMADGETFGFTLSAADKATQDAVAAGTVTLPADAAIASGAKAGEAAGFRFSGISFAKPGIYTFNVSETQWNGSALPADGTSGLTFDRSVKTVTVVVTDSGAGELHAAVTVDGEDTNLVSFVNKYRAADVGFDTAQAQLKKVLEGRDWIDSDAFAFEITALDGGPLPKDASGNVVTNVTVTRDNANNFGFGTITFTSEALQGAQVRVFTYQVREVVPANKLPGVNYSTNVATIKVTVADDGTGKLKASAVTANGTFENRYATEINYTAAGGLNVAKTLTGRNMADGQFEMRVTPADEASANALGLPLGGKVVSMPAAADGQQVVKSVLDGQSVIFHQSDAGKTYTYTVVELGKAPDGYTYDAAERTVTITVADNPEQAALTVTTAVSGGPEGVQTFVHGAGASGEPATVVVPFANSYFASTDEPGGVAASVSATKVLTGRPLEAGEFSFAVKYAADGADVLHAVNAADGTVTFGELHYDTVMLSDLVKEGRAVKGVVDGKPAWTVRYLAYEETDGLSDAGITPQTQPIPFTVTVTDNGNGTLAATANTGEGLAFENAYATKEPAKVGLAGAKALVLGPGLDRIDIAGKFTFTVSSDDPAAPMPERTSVTNDSDGHVDFGDITFTLDDLNRALGVVETQGESEEASDVSADEAGGEETVAVLASEQAGNDAEVATGDIHVEEGAGAVVASASDATADQRDGDASAQAVAAESAGQTAGLAETLAAPRTHVFTYKVTETGSVPGVTNDAQATKTVSFEVVDDGNGNLTVERVGSASNPAFAFTNTYSVEPVTSSVTDQLDVSKTLTGRDMVAGEFSFELVEDDKVVARGTNDADGNVVLDGVAYDKPGTHHYTLREVGGGTTAHGVTYDGATFAVTTEVKDNHDGTLSVEHRFDNGRGVTFANAYRPVDAYVTVGASKMLLGKDLVDGQFTFLLTAYDGTVVQAKNAADGTVTFPKLRFTQPGTYEYTLSELNDAQENVMYDKRTYQVTITVTDDLQGHLVATMTSGDEALTFTNAYVEPLVPQQPVEPDVPNAQPGQMWWPAGKAPVQTGDNKMLLAVPLAAVALAGVAAIVALCVIHRRERH